MSHSDSFLRLGRRRKVAKKQSPALVLLLVFFVLGAGILCFLLSRLTKQAIIEKKSSTASKALTAHIPGDSEQQKAAASPAIIIVYHQARTDRSGAAIHDMLLAHSYAFKHNYTYGGACAMTALPHLRDHLKMIQALGLSHILKFECPPDGTPAVANARDVVAQTMRGGAIMLDRKIYTRFNSRWSPEWLDYIRSQQKDIAVPPEPSPKKSVVAVHIRRGDVSLCDPETSERYIPNQHYQTLLKEYETAAVTIYSERQSLESWDDFRDFRMQLDGSPVEAWHHMMNANVLILSKSSFSIVPALFNPNVVVYTPFWVDPLPDWKVVDDDTYRTMQRAAIRLKRQLCDVPVDSNR